MAPKLYYDKVSPSARAVLMCAKAINLDLDIIEMDVYGGDQLKPEFVKLNPMHTIPTLIDDGFILYDSHAITGYLVDKYAKDKSLYPEDVQKRAIINSRLHFDSSVLFARHAQVAISLVNGVKPLAEELVKAVTEAYGYVEIFLQDMEYIAGHSLSIADLSIITTITNANYLVPLDKSTHPKITAWINRLKTLPYYEINQVGGESFIAVMKSKLS